MSLAKRTFLLAQLSEDGIRLVGELSGRYGVSSDAVTHMLIAVHQGNGSMAQFNHPEFRGSGQWMSGGMTMVSDLFDHQLKALVDGLCTDLSNALVDHQKVPFSGSFQSQSQSGADLQHQGVGHIGSGNSLFVPDPSNEWWPQDLGQPSAVGAQNHVRYALFADSRRLAVEVGGSVTVYDILDHQIGGFGQQQSAGSSITFTSQFGVVDLTALPVVSRDGTAAEIPAQNQAEASSAGEPVDISGQADPDKHRPLPDATPIPPAPATAPAGEKPEDVIALLERLGELKDKGYIDADEFQAKKTELLKRI
ncbi:MAG: SHOCT domain-containing protein [Magnetovibrionaceae bacterium]